VFAGVITRKVIRVFIIAFLALLIVREIQHCNFGCINISSCTNSGFCWGDGNLAFSDSYEQNIPVTSGATLELRSMLGGSIQVKGWDKPFVQVAITKRAATQDDLKKIAISVSSDALQKGGDARRVEIVEGAEGSGWWKGGDWFNVSWSNWKGTSPRIDYELFVPRKTFKSISLGVRSGLVVTRDFETGETLNINSQSGALTVENIKGNVDVRSRSGFITIVDVDGMVNLDSASGSIRIGQVRKNLSVRSRSGAIQIENVQGSAQVETKSGLVGMRNIAGDVRVEARSGAIMLANVSGAVDASAKSGAVTVSRAHNAQGTVKASSRSSSVIVKDHTGAVIAEGRGQIVVK